MSVHLGRIININDGSVFEIPEELASQDDDESTTFIEEPEVQVGRNAFKQFDLLYGECDNLNEDGKSNCELMYAWLNLIGYNITKGVT